MKAERYLSQPYVQQITEAAACGELTKPGAVGRIVVAHDEWCPLLKGKPPCRCRPEVQIVWQGTSE